MENSVPGDHEGSFEPENFKANCYVFVFVDCMYTNTRNQYKTKKYVVYTILGYTMEKKGYSWIIAYFIHN